LKHGLNTNSIGTVTIFLAEEEKDYKDRDLIQLLKDYQATFGERFQFYFAPDLEDKHLRTNHHQILSKECGEKIGNNNSLVIKILDRMSILLPGDIQGKIQNALLGQDQNESILDSYVCMASHHGSVTDNTNSVEWTQRVSPTIMCVSSGLRKYWLKDSFYERVIQDLVSEDYSGLAAFPGKVPFTCWDSDNEEVQYACSHCLFHTYDCGNIKIEENVGKLSIVLEKHGSFAIDM
jgi:hypothetical protein